MTVIYRITVATIHPDISDTSDTSALHNTSTMRDTSVIMSIPTVVATSRLLRKWSRMMLCPTRRRVVIVVVVVGDSPIM